MIVRLLGWVMAIGLLSASTFAEDADSIQRADDADQNDVSQRLVDLLDGCVFVGRFTNDDGSGNLKPERYTISSCQKGVAADSYQLEVRIEYGGKDVTAALTVRIVMADKTPVITLDQVWIPTMGTFDARVLIRDGRYAGTWKHDQAGGHLFGRIEPLREDADSTEPPR